MKLVMTSNGKEHEVDFIDKKFSSETIKYKELKDEMYSNDGVVVICENDDHFANVFASSEGGYAIYWYYTEDLDQFLKGDGEVELDEVDGAHCTGSMRDALEWAYIEE